jgi:hypothetical protein
MWRSGRNRLKLTARSFGAREYIDRLRMDFRRDKTYHDILSEQRERIDEHLIPATPVRWLVALGGLAFYLAAVTGLYWSSGVTISEQADPGTVPVWKHLTGLFLNTSAIGFSAIFAVSLVLWALKQASPKFALVFGVLGFAAGLLVATVL